MKHIKLFEELDMFEPADNKQLKAFFKSKISWKLVNYIQYELTKLEDNGYKCGYIISALMNNGNDYTEIFDSKNGWLSYEDTTLNWLANKYVVNTHEGLLYVVYMKKDGIITKTDVGSEISNSIKMKFSDIERIDINRFQNLVKLIFKQPAI